MGCVGRKLLLNVKCVIQTDKHLIKGFCQLRNFIMAFWNINGNRKILCLNIRNFFTEAAKRSKAFTCKKPS